jgi:hypothetical protein
MNQRVLCAVGCFVAPIWWFVGPAFAQPTPDDIVKSDPVAAAKLEARLLGPGFQVTLDGPRAGEGYLSSDGNWLVFQSERAADNPYFQIYLMNLLTGEVERISPGHGKTTCAWIHPDQNRVLFASTHEDPDALKKQKELLEQRASGNAPRYAWDYDEHFELYAFDRQSKQYANLTNAPGYDAEGSYSPDGQWIAFSSNRRIFNGGLSDEDSAKLKKDGDLAYFADIYLMKADGTELKQLTDERGYDGGPFFSPDGKRICWRHFMSTDTAEIMTMNVDGTDKRQLTRINALSWAPYYHPSGAYLIFGTNRHGFDNFELYLVSVEGGEPVRVTYTAGFDSLPVFTPAGDRLYWTTTRAGDKGGQIFTATWDHDAALKVLGLDDASDIARHVAFLCRPELEGRLTGSDGERKATEYVATVMDQLGMKPAGREGTWFHEFEFLAGAKLGPSNRLAFAIGEQAQSLDVEKDWRPVSFSKSGPIEPSPLVFAGYGIAAPKSDRFEAYNSFDKIEVKDKWVLVFRFMPEGISPEQRQHFALAAGLRDKARAVRDLGGKGLIVVSGPTSRVREQLVPLERDSALAGTSVHVISVSDEVARTWLKQAGKDLNELQTLLDSGKPLAGFDLPNVKLGGQIDVQQVIQTGRNVVGRLQVGPTPSEQVVMVGAHVDHLGKGTSTSLAREDEKGAIHFGADDNASGVATMLEVAESIGEYLHHHPGKLRRDLVFAAWSGEELGLHGSHAYVADLASRSNKPPAVPNAGTNGQTPTAAPASIYPRVAAYLNMDMVGRFDKALILQGIGSSQAWTGLIERLHVAVCLPLTLQKDTFLPTDATSFYQAGVPIVSAFTGTHLDYHTPRDTPDKLNYDGAAQIADFMQQLAQTLSSDAAPPPFVETKQAAPVRPARTGARVFIGGMPEYASEVAGAEIASVIPGSPAEKAGLQGKDVIVEVAGKKIENVQDYSAALQALKVNEKVKFVVLRDGERLELEVVPGSRE